MQPLARPRACLVDDSCSSVDADPAQGAVDAGPGWAQQGVHVMSLIRGWAECLLVGEGDAGLGRRIELESALSWIQNTLDMLKPGQFSLASSRPKGIRRTTYLNVSLLRSWMLTGLLQQCTALKLALIRLSCGPRVPPSMVVTTAVVRQVGSRRAGLAAIGCAM